MHLLLLKSLCVQISVDVRWDRLDGGLQLCLEFKQIVFVVVSHEIYGKSQMSESSRSSYPVEVGLRVLGEVKVYYDVHGKYINSSSEKVRTH